MSDSELEPGEYQHANSGIKEERSPARRSVSPVDSQGSKRSVSPRKRSYSRSRSNGSRSPSYRRRSRSIEHYRRSPKRHSYGRRSHSYERKHSRRRSYSRSRSRSRSFDSRSPLSGRKRHIGDRMNPPSGKCLGVFGLSLYTTESDLQDVFSRYGYIDKCNIVVDQKTGRSRGFGFVYYENVDDAVEAKDRANGMDLDGRKIRVDFSITKRAHTPTPGMYVGRPAPHYSGPPRSRYTDRRCDDRYDRRYDDYRDRGGYHRRSPSPYYSRRRSPSPYRDRRY